MPVGAISVILAKDERDRTAIVETILKGSPAEGKLQVGDVVKAVDGKNIYEHFEIISQLMRGEEGSICVLTVYRPGVGMLDVPIYRASVNRNSSSNYSYGNMIGSQANISPRTVNNSNSAVVTRVITAREVLPTIDLTQTNDPLLRTLVGFNRNMSVRTAATASSSPSLYPPTASTPSLFPSRLAAPPSNNRADVISLNTLDSILQRSTTPNINNNINTSFDGHQQSASLSPRPYQQQQSASLSPRPYHEVIVNPTIRLHDNINAPSFPLSSSSSSYHYYNRHPQHQQPFTTYGQEMLRPMPLQLNSDMRRPLYYNQPQQSLYESAPPATGWYSNGGYFRSAFA